MRELKLQLNIYSPRDYLRIQKHLEDMAAKGWMLEQIDNFFWRYRACQPKKLRFSVLFFQNLDWEGSCKEQCEEAGWQFVTGFEGMQIFCTENPELSPVEVKQTPRWKGMHRSVMSRDRFLWFGMILVALIVLANSIITGFTDPIEVLTDGPRLMYCLLMIGVLIFVLADIIHYYHWRNKARRYFNKYGTFVEPKGNLIGFCTGLGILLVLLLVVMVLQDSYGRLVTILNLVSIIASLLAMTVYQLIRKRKSAETKVNWIVSVAIAMIAFMLLGIVQETVLQTPNGSCQPDDMVMNLQMLTDQEQTGTCVIEEQNSVLLTDLSGKNYIGTDEDKELLWYRITIAKRPELVEFTHNNCLPEEEQDKYESQNVLRWKSQGTWMHKSSSTTEKDGVEVTVERYTYFIYYEDRAATLLVSWELTDEQIALVTQEILNAKYK